MRIRKLTALLTALLLCLSCVPALAAPLRDARNAEVAHDGIQALAEVAFNAYLGPDWAAEDNALSSGQTLLASDGPADPWAGRSLAYAMERSQQTTVISRREADSLLSQVWTGWTALPEGDSDLLRIDGDTVELLPEKMDNGWRIGAYLYDTVFTEDGALVRADLYACPAEYTESIQDIPEGAVRWLLNGELTLRADPKAVFGYTLDACVFSPAFADGYLSAWQQIDNSEGEYSVCLPAQFTVREETLSPAPGSLWKTADGGAEIGIYFAASDASFAETLNNFRAAHADWTVQTEESFGWIYGFGAGTFEMWVASPDLAQTYCLSMRFPAERQAEYEFYAELIRNSFIAWGISNG